MELKAEKRNIFGRKVKTLISKGLVPAELYGHGLENLHLSLVKSDLIKTLKQHTGGLINIAVDGEKKPALLKAVQKDPVSGEVIHVDFYQIKLDRVVKTRVPIIFNGESPAVKEKGGILVKSMSEIEIEALPFKIPAHLEVDLTALKELNQSLRVRDIILPDGVKSLVSPETSIAAVVEKKEEEVAAPVASVEDVKVETEEKKEERAAKKEEAKADSAAPEASK